MRNYSVEEMRALAAALPGTGVQRGDGPAHFAAGPFYPADLRERAAEYERLIPLLRLAADALEREIAADPKCGPEERAHVAASLPVEPATYTNSAIIVGQPPEPTGVYVRFNEAPPVEPATCEHGSERDPIYGLFDCETLGPVSGAAPTEPKAMQWRLSPVASLRNLADDVVNWVKKHGGEARYEPDRGGPTGANHWNSERIEVRTADGWAPAKPGDWIEWTDEWFHVNEVPDAGPGKWRDPKIRAFRVSGAAPEKTP